MNWKAALALRVGNPEIELRGRNSLIGGELEEARGLAIVLRQAATAIGVEDSEIVLRGGVSLVGGELIIARGVAIV
jgi:hypothetical protein